MSVDIETVAEQHAVEATEMEEFNQIDIKNIKSKISDLLNAIGSEGVFDEYTKHNIDHINGMLENLEWIIPEETKENMHSGDWLMLVLSIYFHDLGLLVTPREFENRDETDFETFVEQELFNGEKGRDYEARIREIPDEKQERFLYQEYVRANHAKRIRDWINGDLNEQGGTEETVNEINSLLEDLPRPFVKDLAKICESHHVNDVDDTDKYTVS
jgi:hypothetical protein